MDNKSLEDVAMMAKLLEVKAKEERACLNPNTLELWSKKFSSGVADLVAQESKRILLKGLIETDTFIVAESFVRKNKEEQTRVRPRTRLTAYDTLELSWYREHSVPARYNDNAFRGKTVSRQNGDKTHKYLLRPEYIPKGAGNKYSMSAFKNEPEWVQDVVKEIENKAEILRKQSALLSSIRKSLKEYDRLTEKYFNPQED